MALTVGGVLVVPVITAFLKLKIHYKRTEIQTNKKKHCKIILESNNRSIDTDKTQCSCEIIFKLSSDRLYTKEAIADSLIVAFLC